MSARYITLPNGKPCGLGVYVAAWRQLQTLPPHEEIRGWDHFPTEVRGILAEISRACDERINRHLPWFERGRKWEWVWQADTARAARALNTPRLVIHWLPAWLKTRFAHRLYSHEN